MIHKESWYIESLERGFQELIEKAKRGDVSSFEELYVRAQREGIPWQTLPIPWSVVRDSFVGDLPSPFKKYWEMRRGGEWVLSIDRFHPRTLKEDVNLARAMSARDGSSEKLQNARLPQKLTKVPMLRWTHRDGDRKQSWYVPGENGQEWIDALHRWVGQ